MPDGPDAAHAEDAADAAAAAETAEAVDASDQPAPNRRERRAAARGGPVPKIAGRAAGRLPQPPVRHRDYAARKRG